MATNIILNFYDTVANLPVNVKTIDKFHKFISETFNISENDVKELNINYMNASEKTFIKSTPDLLRCLFYLKSNESIVKCIINLEISDDSRLFNELKSSKIEFQSYSKMMYENKKNEMDLLKMEIEKKEGELKQILEKEKLERERHEKDKIARIIKETEEREKKLKEQLDNETDMIMKAVEKEREMLKERKCKKEKKSSETKDKKEKQDKNEKDDKKKKEDKKIKEDKKDKEEKKDKKDKMEKEEKEEKKDKKDKEIFKKDNVFDSSSNIEKELSKALKKMNEEMVKVVDKVIKNKEKEIKEKSVKSKVVHPGVKCDSCNKSILGTRYKCTVCEDFDFCEECEEKNYGSHNHLFIKIRSPQRAPIKIIVDENIKPKVEERNDDVYSLLTKEMKEYYNLPGISDKKIYNALKETCGNFEEALGLLLKC